MSEYRRAFPNQETNNLKEWTPGRHSQLRLFVAHLENAFNSSLAAQVSQSNKRVFSPFIPKIPDQDINSEVEYREIRLAWAAPKGLKQFLFYETQISETPNFANLDSFVTSDPFYVFPNLLDGRTYYIRIRVVTKNQLFGPWSNNIVAVVPFSQAYGYFDGSAFTAPIFLSEEFQPIFEIDYNAIGGRAYYSIDYEISINVTGSPIYNVEWTDVELQWIVEDNQVGQNFFVTSYGTNNTAAFPLGSILEVKTADIGDFTTPDSLLMTGPFKLIRRGAFVQKLSTLVAGSNVIQLKARVINWHPEPNDWIFNDTPADSDDADPISSVVYGSPATITTKNFNIFEVLTS